MPERDTVQPEQTRTETREQTVYEPPRILFREPLEGVAAACTPSPPGKADQVSCGQAQS